MSHKRPGEKKIMEPQVQTGHIVLSEDFSNGVSRHARIGCVLSDFDRTMVQLFSSEELRALTRCLIRRYCDLGLRIDLPDTVDPYALWSNVQMSAEKTEGPRQAEVIRCESAKMLTEHEIGVAQKTDLFTSVAETLKWLNTRGVALGIISSNSTRAIEVVLKRNRVDEWFSVLYGREPDIEYGRLKPDPALIFKALNVLEATPNETLLIGDSRDDIIAGRVAGVLSLGVTTGKCLAEELLKEGAHAVLPSFSFLDKLPGIQIG